MRWHARNIRAAVKDAAGARGEKAANDGEQRGLAGAVWPDECGNPVGFDNKRNVVNSE
jgi:hypothetical protein